MCYGKTQNKNTAVNATLLVQCKSISFIWIQYNWIDWQNKVCVYVTNGGNLYILFLKIRRNFYLKTVIFIYLLNLLNSFSCYCVSLRICVYVWDIFDESCCATSFKSNVQKKYNNKNKQLESNENKNTFAKFPMKNKVNLIWLN